MTTFRAILVCSILLGACAEPLCPAGTMRSGDACVRTGALSDGGVAEGATDGAVDPLADGGEIVTPTDDACARADFWRDADGDGHGDAADVVRACEAPEGYVALGDDCDDACPTCFPGATEGCDGADQDCDAAIDEDLPEMASYADLDLDGYGDDATAELGCAIPAGRVAIGGDCDDLEAATHPGAAEVCNGIDDDCDALVDEGVLITWYRDCDRDGYAPGTNGSYAACEPVTVAPTGCTGGGWTSRAPEVGTTDCHDFDPSAFPSNAHWYTTPTAGGFSGVIPFDHDCDGAETRRYATVAPLVPCAVIAGSCRSMPGWSGSVPSCGATGTYVTCGTGCAASPLSRAQECR